MKYYKTDYNSETGKKFQALFEKIREGNKKRQEFKNTYNATNYLSRQEPWGIGYSVFALTFDVEPYHKQFRKTFYGEHEC